LSPTPRLQPLTDRRGIVYTARFDPGGTAVYYSAAWDGGPSRIYVTRPGSGASAEIAVPGSVRLLSVSRRGELALLLDPPLASVFTASAVATLAVAPATGGPPRPLVDLVRGADWGPDGESLAVVRVVKVAGGDRRRLEYPVGRVLVESPPDSYFCLSSPRVSPRGDRIAYIDCEATTGAVEIRTVDIEGRQQRLYRGQPYGPQPEGVWGLSWSPAGDEIWFARRQQGRLVELMASDLRSGVRRLGTLGGPLFDVSSRHEALTAVYSKRGCIVVRRSDEPAERELGCGENPLGLARSTGFTLSADGRFVVNGEAVGSERPRVLLRPTNGSPAVPLGEGLWGELSADGASALLLTDDQRDLQLVPTGAGEARSLPTAPLRVYAARFFGDGRRVLLGAAEPGKAGRLWVLDLAGGPPRPITPEQVGVGVPSPDGRWVATYGFDGAALYPVEGGERRSLGDLGSTHFPIVWSDDGCCVYWYPFNLQGTSLTILRLDIRTGERSAWREIAPKDPAGLNVLEPQMTGDGRTYAYGYSRVLSTLNLVSGLR
jgi:dipeptidyl aminopeptidase/acylaminoacyl peptidase